MEFTRKCDKCQQFSPVSKAHLEELTSITSPWPFVPWGIDLIGQLPKVRGSVQYVVVVVDYFTKELKLKHSRPSHPLRSRSLSTRILSTDTEYHILLYQKMTSNSIVMSSRSSAIIYRSRRCSRQSPNSKPKVKSKPSLRQSSTI